MVIDHGDVALLPGWINPHTHLEFSDLPEPVGAPGESLPAWIEQVVSHRRARGTEPTDQIVDRGIDESRSVGVAAIGEIATRPFDNLKARYQGMNGIVFLEAIGLRKEAAELAWQSISSFFDASPRAAGTAREATHRSAHQPAWGVSPHAPYSVRPELFGRLCTLAASRRLPLAIHLAESREELQLLQEGSGPFVALLERLDAWDASAIPRATQPLDYLHMLVSVPRALIVHGNYLDRAAWDFLADHHRTMSVVYCPRTHAYFGHAPYPLQAMLQAGVAVCVGTDSRASSPDLSVLEELRCVRARHPDIRPETIISLGTIDAARAMGLERHYGRLAPGFAAHIVAVDLDDPRDPWSVLERGGD